jgi:DNA-binding transcriptional ArsR family regulator
MIRTYFESALLTLRSIETMGSDEVSKREWLSQTLKLGHRYHLSGELSLRESVSKPKLEAALLSLRDHKLIRVNERAGTLVLTDDARDSQALAELRSRVESFLP